MDTLRIGVLTVSDRAFNKIYEDKGGPEILDWLKKAIKNPIEFFYHIVPDEQDLIKESLVDFCDVKQCCLVLTTGGTGPSLRDVTPDATLAVAHKVLDGFGERMRAIGLKYVPTAILSRQVGVIRNTTLIINLPGQPKAIKETLDELFEAIPYCIDLINGPYIETDPEVVVPFRPKSK
jgi:molybdopterin adenylyltransferase